MKTKITNKFGLPDAFVRAVINDPYDNGGSDFSATSLANPPRAQALIKLFHDKIEVDASSRVAAIIGQGAHSIAERAARPGIDICEKRFFADFVVDGKTYSVSAQLDLLEQDTGTLMDWKTTKAFAFSKKAGGGKKPEWVQQLNVGLEILRRNKLDARRLVIIAMLKDWEKRKLSEAGYPQSEVVAVEIPIWEREKTVEYIETRIRLHVAARTHLPECTSGDSWAGRRCGQWCDASSVCDQFKQMQKTGLVQSDEMKEANVRLQGVLSGTYQKLSGESA